MGFVGFLLKNLEIKQNCPLFRERNPILMILEGKIRKAGGVKCIHLREMAPRFYASAIFLWLKKQIIRLHLYALAHAYW